MKKYIFLTFLIIIFFNCFDKNNNDYDNNNLNQNNNKLNFNLPIEYNKLEEHLGKKFIPVQVLKSNLDTDLDEEIAIAYKINENATINIALFDLLNSGLIKKNTDIDTKIFDADSFIIQSFNFLYENDIVIIFEGKTKENKWMLYVVSFIENNYKITGEFTGDYSVIIDYEEKTTDKSKYHILKEIATIEDSYSYANKNIQQKNVYKWDYEKNEFTLTETGQILSSSNNADKNLNQIEDFMKYINGYWYPASYSDIIKNKNELKEFDVSQIEFISFSERDKTVAIKIEDYLAKYDIIKIYKFWGHRPGVSINIDSIQKTSYNLHKKIDIILLDSETMSVKGPGTYDENTYIRLPKPFIEYINDIRNKDTDEKIIQINKKLKYTFKMLKKDNNDTDTFLTFIDDNKFAISKGNLKENGYYKIVKDNLGFIIVLLFESKNEILKKENFIININSDISISLTPVKIDYDSFTIEDFKVIIFEKDNSLNEY